MVVTVSLFINFYIDKNPQRQRELDEALMINIDLKCLDEVHLVVDDPIKYLPWTVSKKVTLHHATQRPTFHHLFELANHTNGNIKVVANSDISFDESLHQLATHLDQWNGTVLCLSRDDHLTRGSQDVWVFQGHLRIPKQCKFYFGTPHCDHVLARLFHEEGYNVANPSLTIRCHHHASQVRNYTQRDGVKGPQLTLPPCRLSDVKKMMVLSLPWSRHKAQFRKQSVFIVFTLLTVFTLFTFILLKIC